MRHIKLVLDNAIFRMLEKDKEAKGYPNWEDYVIGLFGFSKGDKIK